MLVHCCFWFFGEMKQQMLVDQLFFRFWSMCGHQDIFGVFHLKKRYTGFTIWYVLPMLIITCFVHVGFVCSRVDVMCIFTCCWHIFVTAKGVVSMTCRRWRWRCRTPDQQLRGYTSPPKDISWYQWRFNILPEDKEQGMFFVAHCPYLMMSWFLNKNHANAEESVFAIASDYDQKSVYLHVCWQWETGNSLLLDNHMLLCSC